MKILVVDSHVLFREGLASLLGNQPGIQIIGEVSALEEAVAISRLHSPDIVLLDVGLPDSDCGLAVKRIIDASPSSKVIMLTMQESDNLLFTALRSGAKGYLLKNTSLAKLLASLRAVDRGEAALSRAMMGQVLMEFSRLSGLVYGRESRAENFAQLTNREKEVLFELVSGSTNRMIAENLFISESTVKNHIHNILEKLNLKNRREAARYAQKHGIEKVIYQND